MRVLTPKEMRAASGGCQAATTEPTVGTTTWGGNPPQMQAVTVATTVAHFVLNQVRTWLGCPVRSIVISDSVRPRKGPK